MMILGNLAQTRRDENKNHYQKQAEALYFQGFRNG